MIWRHTVLATASVGAATILSAGAVTALSGSSHGSESIIPITRVGDISVSPPAASQWVSRTAVRSPFAHASLPLTCGTDVLTQSVEPQTIMMGNTVKCGVPGSHTAENGLARSFAISTATQVCAVQFGVASNDDVGPWPVEVRLLEGDTSDPYEELDLRGTSTVMVPADTESEFFAASFEPPVQFQPGENMVVELYLATRNPDEGGDGGIIWLASNDLGEDEPSYVRAPACSSSPNFVPYASFAPHVHLLMDVSVTYAASNPTLELTPPVGVNGVQEGQEFVVRLHMRDLGDNEAAGFQAFLEYDDGRFNFEKAIYTVDPFALHIIDPVVADDGALDLAAGIDVFNDQQPTTDDADLVKLFFIAKQSGCFHSIGFREHVPPSRITSPDGTEILPLELISLPTLAEAADLNGDGVVNVLDLLILLENWGPCPPSGPCPADLNCDGVVNVLDLLLMLENFSS